MLLQMTCSTPCGGTENIGIKHSALYDNFVHECVEKSEKNLSIVQASCLYIWQTAVFIMFCRNPGLREREIKMKWLCTVGVAVSLALQPALADELFGNHPLTPQARDAFVSELLKKMTVDEKIGQLRLISVGPDNPKEAIREMIKDGQVGAILIP
jgi:beta-glucosidase